MQKNLNKTILVSRTGLGLIFCYCLLASIFFSYFAQKHLSLFFLPFPIFIGEIVMFICIPLLVGACKDGQSFNRRTMLLLGLYFGWVLARASVNYIYDGPLTCRNAALFYYPIFAVFAYCFYQKAQIPRNVLMALAFLAAVIIFFKVVFLWYWWTYVTLFVIAVWNTKSVKLRRIGWVFLAVVILLGKEYLYKGPRAHFVSIFFSLFFVVFYFVALSIKRRDFMKAGILLVGFVSFILGFFVFSNRNAVSSLTYLKGIINTYQALDRKYQEKEGAFVPLKLKVHLYNPKGYFSPFSPPPTLATQPAVTHGAVLQPEVPKPAVTHVAVLQPEVPKPAVTHVAVLQSEEPKPVTTQPTAFQPTVSRLAKNMFNYILGSRIREGRSLDLDQNNIVFRLFIWRDMAREIIQRKAWWGFSFGYPQRSRSLEVLVWAKEEWGRDGWITPHNSFLHIIYRAGILGVFLIGILLFLTGKLVRDFFIMNSIEGALLVGALVYWMTLSNFFVILEFPYDAIVFWSLFGITMAYRDGLRTTRQGEHEIKR